MNPETLIGIGPKNGGLTLQNVLFQPEIIVTAEVGSVIGRAEKIRRRVPPCRCGENGKIGPRWTEQARGRGRNATRCQSQARQPAPRWNANPGSAGTRPGYLSPSSIIPGFRVRM